MKHRRTSVASLIALLVGCLSFEACVESSDSPATPGIEAGSSLDGATPPLDANPSLESGSETSTEPDAAAVDAGADAAVDASALAAITCGAPTTLDTGVNAVGDVRAMTLTPGKYAVTWTEAPTAAPLITKGRFFDGSQFLAEQTFSPPATAGAGVGAVGVDGQGRGYVAWQSAVSAPGMGRSVLDPTTGLFGTPTSFAATIGQDTAIVGLSGGGAILMASSTSPTISQYDPVGAAWGAAQILLAGNFRVFGLGASATGKAAATWVDTFAVGLPLYVSTFNGSTWATPVPSTVVPAGAGAAFNEQVPLVYGNGDVAVVFDDSTTTTAFRVNAVRFHAGTGLFDAPLPIDVGPGAADLHAFIDASDRITVVYSKGGRVMASRDVGAGWTAPVDLGAGPNVRMAMDSSGNLAMLFLTNGNASLRRLAAAGSVWTSPVPTGFAPLGGKDMAIAFDALGHPVIFARSVVGVHPALRVVVCE